MTVSNNKTMTPATTPPITSGGIFPCILCLPSGSKRQRYNSCLVTSNEPRSPSATTTTWVPVTSSAPASCRFATKSSVRPLTSTRTLPGLSLPTGKTSVPVMPTSSLPITRLDELDEVILRITVTAIAPLNQPTASAPMPETSSLESSALSASPAPPPNVNMNTQKRSDEN